MKGPYSQHSFDDLLHYYDEACQWLTDIGLKVDISRYGKYRQQIDDFFDFIKQGDRPETADWQARRKVFTSAYYEIHDLIRVYQGLKSIEHTEFSEQVKSIISGASIRDSNGHDSARDFLFELSTGARFVRAGYDTQFNNVCDLVVCLGGKGKLFVECKRVTSLTNLGQNVSKARKQLIKRMSEEKSSKVHGLIATDITALVPGIEKNGYVVMPDTPQASTELHRGQSRRFISGNLQAFRRGAKKGVLGVFCESRQVHTMSSDSPIKGFAYSRHTDYLPFVESEILRDIADKIAGQGIV